MKLQPVGSMRRNREIANVATRSFAMLLADGLFVRSGLFYLLPDVSLKPLGRAVPGPRDHVSPRQGSCFRRSVPGCCVAGCIRVSMSTGNAVAVIDVSKHAPAPHSLGKVA